MKRNTADIIGENFGHLKVIKKDFVKNGKTYYFCECSCGNVIDVRRDLLTRGLKTSCGCKREELHIRNKNTYDLTSEEYGIGYTNDGHKFLFDKEDYDKINKLTWYINDKGYVKASFPKDITLHRLVMGVTNSFYHVDHIYHIKTDCRKSQMRVVTNSQNQMNKTVGKNNKSGCRGVSWHKKSNKWIAQIGFNRKLIYLGEFEKIEDAIKTREEAEQKYFGEYNYCS